MDPKFDKSTNSANSETINVGRRDAVRHLGKFAAYAAPFTVLALTAKKASAATASGGGFHPANSPTTPK